LHSADGKRSGDRYRCDICVEFGDNPASSTFSRGQLTKHAKTKKHLSSLERYRHKLDEEQAAKCDSQLAHTTRFSSPGLGPLSVQHPPDLFHGLRRLNNTWLDEAGNELTLPKTITQDETWRSQRAQEFWHDLDDAMSGEDFVDPESLFACTDMSDDEPEALMPGGYSASEAMEYSPYPSKTVRQKHLCTNASFILSDTYLQMFVLDLLDNKPRLQLSDEHMKSILWALTELGVTDVPSLKRFRGMQKTLAEQINVAPHHHVSAMGNHFYQNSPGTLLAFVSKTLRSIFWLISRSPRIGPIHLSVIRSGYTLRSLRRSRSFGRQASG
jgi:hypothetical protein